MKNKTNKEKQIIDKLFDDIDKIPTLSEHDAVKKQRIKFSCSEEGCTEISVVSCYKSERKELLRKFVNWKCFRHNAPNEVLSTSNNRVVTRLVCVEKDGQKLWAPMSGDDNLGAFQFGNGYKAYAQDFEIGTILEVTATIK